MIPGSANALLLATAAGEAGGYSISRSVRFNSSDSAYLSKGSWSTSTNRDKGTISWWVKRSSLAASSIRMFHAYDGGSNASFDISFNSDHTLGFNYGGGAEYINTTSAVFRDVSAWYHVVCAWDTTDATSSNRIKIYVNGVQQALGTANYPPQNADALFPNTSTFIGAGYGPGAYFNGYLADVHFIDGQALTPSSFTEVDATTGQLIPKQYTGSFGTNGFWLKFSDNSAATATTLGKDYSGNSNNWTPNNLSVTAGAGNDSLVDTPTSYGTDTGAGGEVRGNYCTLNPAAPIKSTTTISNGALDTIDTTAQGSGDGITVATVGVSVGKWYWEITALDITGTTSNQRGNVGLIKNLGSDTLSTYLGANANSYGYYSGNGNKVTNGSGSAYGATWQTNDVIGVALNLDAGTLVFYKNGVSQGTAFSSLNTGETYFPACSLATNGKLAFNFGQRPFAYQNPGVDRPSTDYKALCTTNLPDPLVAKPSEVMDVLLWTGTGTGADRTISGLVFANAPGFIWGKSRSSAYHHTLWDTVRGYGLTNVLSSDRTEAEGWAASGRIKTATPSSITWEADSGSLWYDGSSTTYVAWCWDAGSSTVTNTQGSITSTVRANPSAGFSIVTYTGNGSAASVGHGLGVAPRLIIIKNRSIDIDWLVYTTVIDGSLDFLRLNTTAAKGDASESVPTSTIFNQGGGTLAGANGNNYVAYCFAPVDGYSSFGSYTGNGSNDGPFVYTGHRSRWIMLKRTDAVSDWWIYDTARDTYNVMGTILYPNLSAAEYADTTVFGRDLLSNGFKVRTSNATVNGNGATYIYASFAEFPFQYARAR